MKNTMFDYQPDAPAKEELIKKRDIAKELTMKKRLQSLFGEEKVPLTKKEKKLQKKLEVIQNDQKRETTTA